MEHKERPAVCLVSPYHVMLRTLYKSNYRCTGKDVMEFEAGGKNNVL